MWPFTAVTSLEFPQFQQRSLLSFFYSGLSSYRLFLGFLVFVLVNFALRRNILYLDDIGVPLKGI